MADKKRLDAALVDSGLVSGRDKAKALIMSGNVYLDGEKATKPGDGVGPESKIELRGGSAKYVSRGGLKLEKAIEAFGLKLDGCVCADIGASTGGFTDCMLSCGASRVYAVDVGYGQLDWKLRADSRVIVLERTNARYLTGEQIPEPLELASVDASFISLTLLLPALFPLLCEGGGIVCLIKPQFEAGREKVGKKGVVSDPAVHLEVIEKVAAFASQLGLEPVMLDFSPIKGPQGNIEYLLYLKKTGVAAVLPQETAERTVSLAHRMLTAAKED